MEAPRAARMVGALAIGAGSLGAVACEDPLEPADVEGYFVLESVAGEPLPTVLMESPSLRFRVVGDGLLLNADGTGRRTTYGEVVQLDPEGPTENFIWDLELTYRLDDDRIVIDYVCPPGASCIAPPHLIARRTARGLRAESRVGERGPLIYGPAEPAI